MLTVESILKNLADEFNAVAINKVVFTTEDILEKEPEVIEEEPITDPDDEDK